MKRERLTTNEIEVNKNASYPLVDNMLKNRQQAVDAINEMFNTDVSVEYSSIWRGINDDSDNSISNNGNDENNVAVPNNANAISDTSDKAVNTDELNGNSDGNNSADGDNQSVISGDEQPEETNKKSEQPADENRTETPQPDNEPTKEARETSKEDVENEPENNDRITTINQIAMMKMFPINQAMMVHQAMMMMYQTMNQATMMKRKRNVTKNDVFRIC